MKRCSKCKAKKPTNAFSRRSSSSDGLQSWCKRCLHIATTAFYKANRKRALGYCKKYRNSHIELCRKRDRERRRGKCRGDTFVYGRSNGNIMSKVGYGSMHKSLRKNLGSADKYLCVDCMQPAYEWALNHTSPNLIVDVHSCAQGKVYSMFYHDYTPKCRQCNKADGHPQLEGWTQRLLELGRTSIPLKGTSHV